MAHDPLNPTEAAEYVLLAMDSFVGDPPDSDFQFGYLAALKAVATEGMGITLSPEVAAVRAQAVAPAARPVTSLLLPALWLLLFLTRPAAAMEHEEIVARLATGQCVPAYETRACRKIRRQLRRRTR